MISSEGLVSLIRQVVVQMIQGNGKVNETLFSQFVQGKIDPAYVSGRPKVVFDGETTPSGKEYPYLSNYTPAPNDVVILAKVGGSYIILGKKI